MKSSRAVLLQKLYLIVVELRHQYKDIDILCNLVLNLPAMSTYSSDTELMNAVDRISDRTMKAIILHALYLSDKESGQSEIDIPNGGLRAEFLDLLVSSFELQAVMVASQSSAQQNSGQSA